MKRFVPVFFLITFVAYSSAGLSKGKYFFSLFGFLSFFKVEQGEGDCVDLEKRQSNSIIHRPEKEKHAMKTLDH